MSHQSDLIATDIDAYLAQQLTRIRCDMPISAAKSGLKRKAPNMPAIDRLFDELGFSDTLRNKVASLA